MRLAVGEGLLNTRSRFPFVERIYADGGYAGAKTTAAARSTGRRKIEIVNAPKHIVSRPFTGCPEAP